MDLKHRQTATLILINGAVDTIKIVPWKMAVLRTKWAAG